MINLIIAIIGGITNRIRGGWATDIARQKGWIDKYQEIPFVKDFNDLVYASTMSCVIGFRYDWTALAGFAILFGSMRLGRSMGWGGYISAMIDRKIDHDRDDILILDKWFRGDDEPVLSGWAALSLRGLIWSICLYFGFVGIEYLGYGFSDSCKYISLLGLAMGSIYLLAIEICEKVTFRGNGWQWGEVVFGAYLFSGVSFLL